MATGRRWSTYATAAAAYAGATLITAALWDAVFARVPFALFFAAVVLTARVGTFLAAVGVAVAGAMTVALLMSEPGQLVLGAPALLLGIAVFLAFLVERRTRDRQRLEALHARADAERARLEAVVQQMPLGVMLADAPTGRIVLANEAAARILRHPLTRAESVDDYAAYHGFHPDGRPYAGREYPLARALLQDEIITNEPIDYVCGDGSRRRLHVSAGPIRDRADQTVAALVVFSDVTDELAREQQLRQSQRLEAIGRLAGGVAHDFNNLLTVIIGSGVLALDSLPANDPVRPTLEEITRSAHRAADLTRQLLAFSRRQLLQPKVVDLNAIVRGVSTMLKRLLGEHIELTTHLDPALRAVMADPGQLEQIITNLVLNARDAMPAGGHVTIETANVNLDESYTRQHADVRPGPHVMVAVSDTGVGMDRETMARLFEPFFTTKERGRGTGLGLATVYGIVTQGGGHIAVQSEPEKGTTFKVYFPQAASPAEEEAIAPAPTRAPGGSETVLLVEDEDAVRGLIREALTRAGYSVVECRNADEAEARSSGHCGGLDLLITDVVMPGRSGHELAARVLAQRPAMRVLYISGYTDNAIAHHGVIDPGVAFLGKPFTPDQLLHKVRQVLDQPQA